MLGQYDQLKSLPPLMKEDHTVLGSLLQRSLRRVVLIPLLIRKSFAVGAMKNIVPRSLRSVVLTPYLILKRFVFEKNENLQDWATNPAQRCISQRTLLSTLAARRKVTTGMRTRKLLRAHPPTVLASGSFIMKDARLVISCLSC